MKMCKGKRPCSNKGIARCDKDNYRPISILPTVSKAVIEHFVHLQLYSHLTKNNLLFDKQFSFRQRRSTANYSLSVCRCGPGHVHGRASIWT